MSSSLFASSLKGAMVGGAIGATVTVTMHMMSPPTKETTAAKENPIDKEKFRYIDENADVRFLVEELTLFQRDEESNNAFEVLCDSMDRLLALEYVSGGAEKESAEASWPTTAHHYNQEIVDALSVLRSKITRQEQKVTFDMHTEELKNLVQNTLYNIDMSVRHALGG